ncbi:hypothetical protein LYZ82_24385, partial [Xanthomonas hortorum pv. hederae]|uniref:hypothetical protein n=1 Tax=Xanthomonas hortorum TaxID=56454 RepID=UPI001F459917
PAGLLALAQAFSVAERQLHGLLLNMRRVVSRIYGALFRGSLGYLSMLLNSSAEHGAQLGASTV